MHARTLAAASGALLSLLSFAACDKGAKADEDTMDRCYRATGADRWEPCATACKTVADSQKKDTACSNALAVPTFCETAIGYDSSQRPGCQSACDELVQSGLPSADRFQVEMAQERCRKIKF